MLMTSFLTFLLPYSYSIITSVFTVFVFSFLLHSSCFLSTNANLIIMHFLFQPYSPKFSRSYNFDTLCPTHLCFLLFLACYISASLLAAQCGIPINFLQNLAWTLFNSLRASIPIPQYHTCSLNQILFHIYSTLYHYTGGCCYTCVCLQEELDIFLRWLMFSVYSNLVCFPVWLLEIYHLPLYSSHSFSVLKLSLIFLHS